MEGLCTIDSYDVNASGLLSVVLKIGKTFHWWDSCGKCILLHCFFTCLPIRHYGLLEDRGLSLLLLQHLTYGRFSVNEQLIPTNPPHGAGQWMATFTGQLMDPLTQAHVQTVWHCCLSETYFLEFSFFNSPMDFLSSSFYYFWLSLFWFFNRSVYLAFSPYSGWCFLLTSLTFQHRCVCFWISFLSLSDIFPRHFLFPFSVHFIPHTT